jgi:hypothetical protein
VQFRRKKIILKYVPEGTSRLLQVRLTVQFQSVLDAFVPHDTVLSFAAPAELTESVLTSACMLHPSPMSLTSSSSSLRRQRLGEISEDAEETPHIRGQSKSKVATTLAPPSTDIPGYELEEPPSVAVTVAAVAMPPPLLPEEVVPAPIEKELILVRNSSQSTPRESSATPTPTADKLLPSTPEPTPPNTSDGKSTVLPAPDKAPELRPIQHLSNSHQIEESHSRDSIQSVHPAISTGRPSFSNYDTYDHYKPKVKRGPRPHVEPELRPQTAGSSKKAPTQRLVANLPTSVRTQNRSNFTNTDRPGSQQSSRSVPSKFAHYSEAPAVPPLPSPSHISSLFQPQHNRAYSRAGSITSTATAAATPEKLRLMKALQMRKRAQQMAKRESERPRRADDPATSIHSQFDANLMSVRSQSAAGNSGAESTSASRMEEAAKASEAARMTSPTSMTNVSEVPSTQSSSFVEDNDGATSHASISSDTGSSLTPKADAREAHQRKQAESPVPVPARKSEDPSSAPAQEAISLSKVPSVTTDVQKTTIESPIETTFLSGSNEQIPSHEQRALSAPPAEAQAPEHVSDAASQEQVERPEDAATRARVPTKSEDGQERRRRGPPLDPINVLSSAEQSEASDDDSFMEELQHAKVQQAKPMAVGRSPVTPIFRDLSVSVDRWKDVSRSASSPLIATTNSGSTSPEQARPRSVRSISTALPSWPPSNENVPPVPLAKKGPLSSGISKRIKALEVFTSARETSSSPPAATQSNTLAKKSKAALASSRKRLSFVTSGNVPDTSTNNPPHALLPTPVQILEIEPTDYEQSRPLYSRQSSATAKSQAQQKAESISVTARIVRNPNTINEDSTVNDSQQMSLQRSTLTIEHERLEPLEHRPTMTREDSSLSMDSSAKIQHTERARPSFSSYRSDSQTRLPTSDSMASRLSLASGKRKDKGSLPRSASDNSSFTEDKTKQSRARRLMKRVSNLSTSSRRNIAGAFSPSSKEQVTSDTINERAESDHDLASVAEPVSQVIDIGDVNVQFPDTLLWKRRFLRIDDQGYLIFTPPTMERNNRNISRKFHLSEFRTPTLPDIEREEMAWSILLDLEDGSCIQCACESKYTQTQVLRSKSCHAVLLILE